MTSAMHSLIHQQLLRVYARWAGWWCAMLTVALLLLQPLLCTITCLVHHHGWTIAAQTAHEHHAEAVQHTGEGAQFFLCEFQHPGAPHVLFVPAFWPGLLPALLIALSIGGLLYRLIPQSRVQLPHCRRAPPLPPPRLLAA